MPRATRWIRYDASHRMPDRATLAALASRMALLLDPTYADDGVMNTIRFGEIDDDRAGHDYTETSEFEFGLVRCLEVERRSYDAAGPSSFGIERTLWIPSWTGKTQLRITTLDESMIVSADFCAPDEARVAQAAAAFDAMFVDRRAAQH